MKKQNYCQKCGEIICINSKNCKSCSKMGKKNTYKRRRFNRVIDVEKLKRLYIKENKSSEEISKIINIPKVTICRRLHYFGIKINRKKRKNKKVYYCMDCGTNLNRNSSKRCHQCNSKFLQGNNSPRFKDGSSRKCYQRIAKNSHKYICSKCCSTNNLCVHHIDKNRHNNEVSNLTFLCRSCHSNVHNLENNFGDRKKYQKQKERLKDKGGFKLSKKYFM